MIQNERDSRHEQVLWAARQMMTAARTAPKAKGVDIVEVALVSDEELTALAQRMKETSVVRARRWQPASSRVCYINRYARISYGIKLRSLWFCYVRCTCRGCTLRFQCHRCRYCHWFCLCHGCRLTSGHPCHVFSWSGGYADGLSEGMPQRHCHPRQRFIEESFL